LIKEIYKHVKAQQLAEQPHVEEDPRFTPGSVDSTDAPPL
jgi:GTP-binding protein